MWSTVCQFIAEFIRFFLVRGYEGVKHFYHQGYRDGRRKLPPLKHRFLQYSGTKLAQMIRDKEVCIQRNVEFNVIASLYTDSSVDSEVPKL